MWFGIDPGFSEIPQSRPNGQIQLKGVTMRGAVIISATSLHMSNAMVRAKWMMIPLVSPERYLTRRVIGND
jgi:hypothetical protein